MYLCAIKILLFMIFSLTPKNKQYKGITPQLSHYLWRERVTRENEIKAIHNKTTDGDLSLIRNLKYSSVSPGKRKQVFTKETVNLFTDFINTKEKFKFPACFSQKIKPIIAVNCTRLNNGGHIPKTNGNDKTKYSELFAKKSYIKPHQLPEDSTELPYILDNIRTDKRLTHSRKHELIKLALKFK